MYDHNDKLAEKEWVENIVMACQDRTEQAFQKFEDEQIRNIKYRDQIVKTKRR